MAQWVIQVTSRAKNSMNSKQRTHRPFWSIAYCPPRAREQPEVDDVTGALSYSLLNRTENIEQWLVGTEKLI
jgi:hypothetical protein